MRHAGPENSSAAAFASYLDSYPATLRAWDAGEDLLYPTLGWINTQAVVELRQAFTEMGVAGTRVSPIVHNQAGVAVAWAIAHLRAGPSTDPLSRSRCVMWELARRRWVLGNLVADVRSGARGFETNGRRISMPFVGDAAIDALDRMLDLVAEMRSLDMERPATGPAIKAWMDAGGRDVPWMELPDFVRAHFRDWARRLMDQYPRYLPGELEAGGFTMSQAELVLRELLARAQHSQACLMRFSTSAAATLPFVRLDDLADDLASSVAVPATSVRRLLEVLTLDLDRSPDPCLTPIVPVGKYVVPMSCLIAPGSPLRNLTSLLQLDPERFGAAGRALGRLGVDSVAETLDRMAGATVATNVLLASPSGVRLGDLDVVVVDPSTRTMVVFEVLWQIGPDGAQEINRAVTKAQAKRDQVDRNRRHLMSGTGIARWPAGWPDVSDYAVRWYILTRDVLPVDTTRSDTIIRSHQMLASMLRADASIADLIDLLDDPPTPPKELSELHSATMKFGRYTVEWTQVAI